MMPSQVEACSSEGQRWIRCFFIRDFEESFPIEGTLSSMTSTGEKLFVTYHSDLYFGRIINTTIRKT